MVHGRIWLLASSRPLFLTFSPQQQQLLAGIGLRLRCSQQTMESESSFGFCCSIEGCEFKSRFKIALERHLISHSDDDDEDGITFETFKCSYEGCEHYSVNILNLRKHQKEEHGLNSAAALKMEKSSPKKSPANRDFECDNCEETFRSAEDLNRHFEEKHKKNFKRYACNHCDYRTNDRRSVQGHYKRIHDASLEYNIECDFCPWKTDSERGLIVHMMKKHPRGAPSKKRKLSENSASSSASAASIRKFSCHLCPYQGSRKFNLEAHVKSAHKDREQRSSDSVRSGPENESESDLSTVNESASAEYEDATDSGINESIEGQRSEDIYECEKCDFSAPSLGNLNRHIGLEHKQGKNETNKQSSDSKSESDDTDINKDSGKKCGRCDYRSNQSGHIKRHARQRHPDNGEIGINETFSAGKEQPECDDDGNAFECGKCSFSSSSEANVRQHLVKVHNLSGFAEDEEVKEKKIAAPLNCEFCEFSADLSDTLKWHVKTHHKDRRENEAVEVEPKEKETFQCPKCPFKTKHIHSLRRHIKTLHDKKRNDAVNGDNDVAIAESSDDDDDDGEENVLHVFLTQTRKKMMSEEFSRKVISRLISEAFKAGAAGIVEPESLAFKSLTFIRGFVKLICGSERSLRGWKAFILRGEQIDGERLRGWTPNEPEAVSICVTFPEIFGGVKDEHFQRLLGKKFPGGDGLKWRRLSNDDEGQRRLRSEVGAEIAEDIQRNGMKIDCGIYKFDVTFI